MKNRILVSIAAVVMFASSANAAISVTHYAAAKKEGGQSWLIARIYLDGISEGFGWANLTLKQNHQKPLYCPPQDLPINEKNITDIVDRMIETHPNPPASITVDLLLIAGLQETFPCEK